MKKKIILCCPFIFSSVIHGENISQECRSIPQLNEKGRILFKKKQFTEARMQYETAISYLEMCQNAIQLPKDPHALAIGYNNTALTYIKQKQYGKANAWLSLAPDAPQTRTNLRLIPKNKFKNQFEGKYWHYAGQSFWSSYTVKKLKNKQYQINFDGTYTPAFGAIWGPNIGIYQYTTVIKNHTTTWTNPENTGNDVCQIQLKFSSNTLTAKTQANDLDSSCGFGHNVSADGTYQRVQ